MSFRLIGKSAIDIDRMLCMQPAPNSDKAIIITFDTGEKVTIEDDDPAKTIASHLTHNGTSRTSSTGVM
jgi:hypothetical protein